MATILERGGLGFEKFFRRKGCSAKDGELSAKAEKESSPSKFGKFFGQKQPDQTRTGDRNESVGGGENAAKEIDEAGSQKTNESRKSSKRKQFEIEAESCPERPTDKANDKCETSGACKDFLIKDDVGQVKLTEIINNSIKEAVLNIVKEGVGPLTDSPDLRVKDTPKKLPISVIKEIHDKENNPACRKHVSSQISGANKTFDSHLCRSNYQQSPRTSSPASPKLNNPQGRPRVNNCLPEVSSGAQKTPKSGKVTKHKDKSVRADSPKIYRQPKGQSGHFRTDNRRMTGNVNIYICSEANENAKDNRKSRIKNDCTDDSESATSSGSLSVSTSKLVAALKKKRKQLADQSLSSVSETPQNSVGPRDSDDKIGDDDDVLSVCDEDIAEGGFPDADSTSSKDACDCGDTKSSDADFCGSDEVSLQQPCSSSASDGYASYDRDDFWPRVTQDRAICVGSDAGRRFDDRTRVENVGENVEQRCSCCDLRKCQEDRSSVVTPSPRGSNSRPERRKTRDKISRAPRDAQQFGTCPCIVEEVDEDCGNERKKSEGSFSVCGMPSMDEDHRNGKNETGGKEKKCSKSGSVIMKDVRTDSPEGEKRKSARNSDIESPSGEKTIDQEDEPNVEAVIIDPKPQSPKPALLSSWKKNFRRSSDKDSRKSNTVPTEITEDAGRTKNIATEENGKNDEASKDANDNVSPLAEDKRKSSFLFRSFQKAMSIVRTSKDEDVTRPEVRNDEENEENVSKVPAKTKMIDDEKINDEKNENVNCEGSCNGMDRGNCTLVSSDSSKEETRSRSRISTAIASRRSLAAVSHESSNVNVSCCQPSRFKGPNDSSAIPDITETRDSGQRMPGCQCGKPSESPECRCKKSEPTTEQTCECYNKRQKSNSGTNIRCNNPAKSRKESSSCKQCENSADKCICRRERIEPIEPDPCKYCSGCSSPNSECKCRGSRVKTMQREICKGCRRPKRFCRCDAKEKSRTDRSQTNNRVSRDFPDRNRRCSGCRSPKADCRCGQTSSDRKYPKSMICVYCDKPQDDCVCNAPIRKCSQCGLPLDVCNCKPLPCCDCSERHIIPDNDGEKSTIRVTAWKPRRSVRRYFSREPNDPNGNSDEDCACHEKPYGSDGLAYQKGNVFSDVMSELQQKICDSVGCNICRKIPCDCGFGETENEIGRRPRQRLSSVGEKISTSQSQDRSTSKSPVGSCRCGTPRKKSGGKVLATKICDRCNTSPCRCRRSTASSRTRPSAKCYYCKSSPCICTPVIEPTNPRPFGKADSSHRRRKECNSTEEHVNADVENEDNGHRGRENSHVASRSGRQQPRKYCYRGNPIGQHTSRPGECVG